ncbi:hypothetical protein MRX96_030861 [Rhipicephalus microplus]
MPSINDASRRTSRQADRRGEGCACVGEEGLQHCRALFTFIGLLGFADFGPHGRDTRPSDSGADVGGSFVGGQRLWPVC